MTEQEWDGCAEPQEMLEFLRGEGEREETASVRLRLRALLRENGLAGCELVRYGKVLFTAEDLERAELGLAAAPRWPV